MKICKHCENEIDDPETALYDGAYWFCDEGCQARYLAAIAIPDQTDVVMEKENGTGASFKRRIGGGE